MEGSARGSTDARCGPPPVVHDPLCPGPDRDRDRRRGRLFRSDSSASQLKPLGDGFIALIKMMIAPVIFCTIVHGIASMGDLKKVGRVGVKTLFYFEAVSTLALAIGLIVGEVLQPGKRLQYRSGRRSIPMRSRAMSRARRKRASSTICWRSFPDTFVGALRQGRPAAGAADLDPDRLCDLADGRARRARGRRDRSRRPGILRNHPHRRARWRRSGHSAPWLSRSARRASARS